MLDLNFEMEFHWIGREFESFLSLFSTGNSVVQMKNSFSGHKKPYKFHKIQPNIFALFHAECKNPAWDHISW